VNAAVALLGLAGLLAADGTVARQWQAQTLPTTGPSQAIGACSNGCLQGAATLPASGPGYEVLRLKRNRRFGHPNLVAYIRRLAAAARNAKLGLVVVGDLSQPRGGPTPSGHRSHQTGLDADVGYAAPPGVRAGHLSREAREQSSPPAVIDLATHETTAAWTPAVAKLLALAAADPAVDRIFVNPAIKKLLCAGPTAKAPWQGRLRPWWAHHDHFHERLKCPADSPHCVPQEQPPDDGCGATLAWWFSEDAQTTRTKKKEAEGEAPEPTLPPACIEVMQAKSGRRR
jgi:penicillin-insensitive murein DD-endopeptidase